MAKKKSINLSALIKQYDIKDDISKSDQYGFGSFLKDNAVPLLKTGVGAALTATGVAAPVGIGLMASGAGEIASNELAKTPEEAAAMQQTAGLAGTVGGLGAQGAFNSQMAQGGELTQYNGGGTHEENPRGGIDVGPNAQVEDKETRWEDYIFSDRIKIPGKKYTFAEASKKIANKYKRENDSFEKKAKEKEMKGLMAMHEGEKEKMQIKQQQEFQKAFGGDINQFPDGGDMTFITDPNQLAQRNREGEQLRVSQIQETGNATGVDYMNPAERGAAIKDKFGQMSFSDAILNDLNTSTQASTPPTSFGTTENGSNRDLASQIKSNNYSNSTTTHIPLTESQELQNQQNRHITPFNKMENYKILSGVPNEKLFPGYKTAYNEDGTKVVYDKNSDVYKEKMKRTAEIDNFRQTLAKQFNLPTTERGLTDASKLDPNFTLSKEQLATLNQDELNTYYDNLQWKNDLRAHEGWQPKNYYGDKEAKAKGYTSSTPLRELNFGPRFLTGVQNQNFDQVGTQKAYGGKIQAQWGLDLNSFEAINQAQNPDIGALASGASQQGVMGNTLSNYQSETDFNNNLNPTFADINNVGIQTPNSTPSFGGMGTGFSTGNDYASMIAANNQVSNNSDYTSPIGNQEGDPNKKFDWGKAGMFGAQNIGNLYNIGKGLQGAEQVNLGQINPQKYDYSKALKNAEDKYTSAANISRESIRKSSTSSGQSLSNMIAANTSLTQGQERATRDIMQQQDNQNTGLTNQAEQYNLGLRNQESQMNSQNEAMKDQFLAQGISGIGSNIAQFSRDNRADKMQQGYIENLLKTGKYEIDPVTGKVRLIGSENI